MIMVSEHYDIRELVHPAIYEHPAIGDRCANFIHPNLPITLEALLTEFGEKPVVNNWHTGGGRTNSGLRDWHSPYGAGYSSHYYGNTCDCYWKTVTPLAVYKFILDHPTRFPFIIRMEAIGKTPTWNHIEVGTHRIGDIKIFNP
jgi:hypothetical protein